MLLAYVDESYTADKFYLSALVVADGEQARAIEEGLDALLVEFRSNGAAPVPANAEFHGKEIFHGQGGWSGVGVRARVAIYRRALELITVSGARVAIRGMDCRAQRVRYANPHPPHEVVLAHLLESLDKVAIDEDEHVLVVADEVHASERHRTNFRSYKRIGTPGYQSSKLDRIRDTIHFAPSIHSRLLQAADLVTYLYRRTQTHSEPNDAAKEATSLVWAAIEPAVIVKWTWRP